MVVESGEGCAALGCVARGHGCGISGRRGWFKSIQVCSLLKEEKRRGDGMVLRFNFIRELHGSSTPAFDRCFILPRV